MLSRLISEVEYDKCKHVTAVNSTKHGIESLAGVKEQTFSFMEACLSSPGIDRGALVWGRQGHLARVLYADG